MLLRSLYKLGFFNLFIAFRETRDFEVASQEKLWLAWLKPPPAR